MQVPNVEWTLEIGPLKPQAKKKRKKGDPPQTIVHSMSKSAIFAAISQCLSDITEICSGREPKFSKKWDPMKVVKVDGKTFLRLRFFIESPSSITRLERLKPGFKRLRAQADYS